MPKIILNGIDYANGIDQAKLAKIGDAALTTVAQDLSGAVNELKSNLTNIGTFYSYSWTANSSNAYGVQLTQAVTLPKGVYILIGVAPILSVTDFTLLLSANKSINAPFQFNAIRNRTPISFTFQVTEDDTNVWLSAGGSISVSYTNISDGSGRIIRVSGAF